MPSVVGVAIHMCKSACASFLYISEIPQTHFVNTIAKIDIHWISTISESQKSQANYKVGHCYQSNHRPNTAATAKGYTIIG